MAKDVLEVLRDVLSTPTGMLPDEFEDLQSARDRIAELIAAAERSKRSARLMQDDRQQEVVCIPPDQWNALCAAFDACRGLA